LLSLTTLDQLHGFGGVNSDAAHFLFHGIRGFSSRVRRFDLGPEGLTDEATLLETAFGSSDNFEGISVWRDAEGRTRVTLIADDNFFALQSTAIAEYVLVEG